MTDQSIAEVAAGLTKVQRSYVTYYQPGERKMGGYGYNCGCPGLIEPVGVHHPIFGGHHRLTERGIAVRNHLISQGADHDR